MRPMTDPHQFCITTKKYILLEIYVKIEMQYTINVSDNLNNCHDTKDAY